MDSVRFGRALGMGARSAAKAIAMAADAAAAKPADPAPRNAAPQPRTAARPESSASARVRETRTNFSRGGKRFGQAAWGPFVKLSGVLWLELTGVFFGLFLLTALLSTWRLRGSLHDIGTNHADHQRLLWSIAMAIVFGYFCLSSFIRAARRERGKD